MKEENNKLERLIALLLINTLGNKPLKDKIMQLNIAGFSNMEIAELLQVKPQTVNQMLYLTRKTNLKKQKNIVINNK